MRFMPARTAVCTAADIECDLPVRRPLCIARDKDPVLGRVIAQSSYQLIGFLRCHLIDVPAQLVHALNFTQKAISHCRRPFYDFAFYVGIFLASYITFLPFILSTSARIFSVVRNTWCFAAA